ncbi:hypothetical protein GCM10009584_02760 [Ornithinimicrobium humiphilum]|uniref:Golgi phosphoprotein 3 GPP34 n=1 Tax=Ornithinimicrobium humiphilum TaxID=125288 RepID=A0A543K7E4_9MICO|nr:GPP34 family phosphoprotein [Ornithinimicrobium humiphilum]TQM91012.1 Golgi phosphoprotein 3 GPP34 [Ornithinimicrobium humiphilum]
MLIAEELLLVGTAPDGRNLLGTQRQIVVAGALLTELVLRERLDVDDRSRLRMVAGGTIGEPLLDDALVRFGERQGKKPKDVLGSIGRKVEKPVFESLVRRELVRPEPVRALGMTWMTRWPVLEGGPRDTIVADLLRVVCRMEEPNSRTGALVSLLQAVDALPRVLPKEMRPGVPNRDVRRRGKEITKGRWASEAVVKAVQEATAATMAAVGAATAASSSS